MKRREFITLLGGAAAVWPQAARAQQSERMRRIGVLTPLAAEDPEHRRGLRRLRRRCSNWAGTRAQRADRHARGAGMPTVSADTRRNWSRCAGRDPCHWRFGCGAAVKVTRRVPVVFTQTPDPVGAGFVDSLARPGGSATGFTLFEYGTSGKWLELLKEVAPGVTRAAILRDAAIPQGSGQFGAIQSVAPSFGVELRPVDVNDPSEMERAVGAFAHLRMAV